MQKRDENRKIHVLMVDDDRCFLNVAKECLKLHGNFDIYTAFSSDEAYKRISLQTQKFEVIICDYDMPGKNGLELLKIIRDEGIKTPFIFFTNYDVEVLGVKANSFGVNGIIKKFGNPDDVFSSLKDCIKSLSESLMM